MKKISILIILPSFLTQQLVISEKSSSLFSIFSEKNFDVIEYYISKPNFITLKKIKAQIIKLESNKKPKRFYQ